MAPNLSSLLSQNADAFKEPPLLPEGTYYGTIQKWEPSRASAAGNQGVQFSGVYTGVHEDVDLSTAGHDGEPLNISGRKWYYTFWPSEEGTNFHRLTKFLSEGLGMNTAGRPLDQLLAEAVGQQVQINVGQVPNKEQNGMVNQINGLAGA